MNINEIKKLGRYDLRQVLGRGATGVVFLGFDPVIHRTVAVKTLVIPEGLPEETRQEHRDRFFREALAIGRLSHPAIVAVHDAGQDEPTGQLFLALEYVPGRTLRDEIGMPEARAIAVFQAIGEALQYAHGQGVVHRDLKPANVLLGEDGGVKITDFGIARLPGSELTRTGASLGSPAYMSPEQASGQPVDGRSDLFSLGVLVYEILSGRRPFEAEDASAIGYQVVHQEHRPIRQVAPDLSPAWDGILSRLLAKRPEDRYPDAAAFLRDLEPLRERQKAIRPALTAASVPRRNPGRRALAFIAVAALLAVFLLLAQLGASDDGRVPVEVQFRHRLEGGTLRIEVDGEQAVNLRFTGTAEADGTSRRREDTAEIPLRLAPGEHRLLVEVTADRGKQWSRTIEENLPQGGRATLTIRVMTRFNRGLKVDWAASEEAG